MGLFFLLTGSLIKFCRLWGCWRGCVRKTSLPYLFYLISISIIAKFTVLSKRWTKWKHLTTSFYESILWIWFLGMISVYKNERIEDNAPISQLQVTPSTGVRHSVSNHRQSSTILCEGNSPVVRLIPVTNKGSVMRKAYLSTCSCHYTITLYALIGKLFVLKSISKHV